MPHFAAATATQRVHRPAADPATDGRARLGLRIVWLAACLSLLFPAAAMAPQPVAASSCTGWTSTTRPPNTIRVLTRKGKVARVDFRRYVGVVMASGEWPSRLPQALLEAGAVAVKQFAWFHSLKGNHRRSFVTAGGQCYDVVSTTRDQMYVPGRSRISAKQWRAIDATWNLSLRKNGRFVLTAYRAGSARRCGADAVGKRIYQRSAKSCARDGYSARQILRAYYGPGVTFVGSAGHGAAPKPDPQPKADLEPNSSAQRAPNERPGRPRRPRPAATPRAEPELEVVAWWEVALGEKPSDGADAADALDDTLAQANGPAPAAGQRSAGRLAAPRPHGAEIRVSALDGGTDEFPPLIGRSSASSSDTASVSTAVSFMGRAARLSALPGPAGKVVSVYVDGELAAMVDMFWPQPHQEVVVFEREWPNDELHTIRLVLLGASEQLRLELDANQLHY